MNPQTRAALIDDRAIHSQATGIEQERRSTMSVITRFIPMSVLSGVITLLLRLGVRMTIFGPMMLLTVRGRKTGKARTTPVDLHDYDGRRYLIATHGVGSWVYNLRASGEGVLSLGWNRQAFRAAELPPEVGGPVIKQVLGPLLASDSMRGSALRENFALRADASLNDFIDAARSHPVFELSALSTPSSQR